MSYLGIDLGTSAVKISLLDSEANIVRSVTADYPLSFPYPGYVEQDPADWWRVIKSEVQKLLQESGCDQLAAIGVGGQMHGLVALDRNGQVIRPAILWNDTRTEVETAFLNEQVGKAELISATGNIAYAGFTAPKLLWLKKHEPENFARLAHVLLPKDYIVYMLTGEFSTDFSDASGTLLLNVAAGSWSDKMCRLCLPDKNVLPRLHESSEVVGEIRPEIQCAWGLKNLPRVVAGAGDNAAAAIATATVNEGDCNISLGTSGTVFMPLNKFRQDAQAGLHAFADASGKYHFLGCTLSAASCYKWWTENISGEENRSGQPAEEKFLHNSVYFMPYLMGERSPLNDTTVRAGFLGLTAGTVRQEMLVAIYEGVAFSIKDCIEVAENLGIRVTASTLVGGGAKSELWCQIMADVLQLPLTKPEGERGAGYGAALLAYAGFNKVAPAAIAKAKMVAGKVFYPRAAEAGYYKNKYKNYRELYPALREFYRNL